MGGTISSDTLKTFPRHCNTQNTGCQNIRLYYILGYVITVQQPRITVVDNNFQFLCTSSCTASLANLVVCWEPSSMTGDIKTYHCPILKSILHIKILFIFIYPHTNTNVHTTAFSCRCQLDIFFFLFYLCISSRKHQLAKSRILFFLRSY